MKIDEFEAWSKYIYGKRMALSRKKSHDYATEDKLSNFKRVGRALEALIGSGIDGKNAYFLVMIVQKLDRIVNLLGKGEKPQNEALVDSFIDLENYVDLWSAYLKENGFLS